MYLECGLAWLIELRAHDTSAAALDPVDDRTRVVEVEARHAKNFSTLHDVEPSLVHGWLARLPHERAIVDPRRRAGGAALIPGRGVLWLGLAQLISWGITYYLIGGFGDAMTADLG